MVCSQMSRGLDVKTTKFIYSKIREQKGLGKIILLVSYDLEEILGLSDKIGVMFKGTLRIVNPKKIKRRDIEKMMISSDSSSLSGQP